VQLRRLTSQAIVTKEYHYEMPFEVQADGPYFNILDFFGRLGRLSRIINVGDLNFADPAKSAGAKYPVRPGTTVSGVFTATTFFTKPSDAATSTGLAKPAGKR
jgi:Tfp pilus assembly protein PilO